MSDIYQKAIERYKGSPSAVILFIAAFVMFSIGVNHFIEDTVSSKLGIETLERSFNLNAQIFDWSYWTMSLAPQFGSVVFMYLFLADTKRKEYLGLAGGFQAMDFFADSWYRSNSSLFSGGPEVFIYSTLLTLIYYSMGSELFLTVGLGIMIKMVAPALQTWKSTWQSVESASRGNYSPPQIPVANQNSHPAHKKGKGRAFHEGQRKPNGGAENLFRAMEQDGARPSQPASRFFEE